MINLEFLREGRFGPWLHRCGPHMYCRTAAATTISSNAYGRVMLLWLSLQDLPLDMPVNNPVPSSLYSYYKQSRLMGMGESITTKSTLFFSLNPVDISARSRASA